MIHATNRFTSATSIDLIRAGLLELGARCAVHLTAVFLPADYLGEVRPIVVGEDVSVGAFAIVHGGTSIAAGARIGHHAIVGEPEHGYAVRRDHPGAGDTTTVGTDAVIRAGAIVYAGCTIGDDATIGHHTLLRTNVVVGAGSQLAANLTVERGCRIGAGVRCSPGTHLTADTLVADRVFLGAGVRTVNDNDLIWRDPDGERPLRAPTFGYGCKVGSGAVILAGVRIGREALVGAGSVVTRDVTDHTVVYGVPAVVRGSVRP